MRKLDEKKILDIIETRKERNATRHIFQDVNREAFVSALLETDFKKYDTTIWSRRDFF